MSKRKNPADLTRRNLKAAKKREATLEKRIAELEQRVTAVAEHVKALDEQLQLGACRFATSLQRCSKCGFYDCQLHL